MAIKIHVSVSWELLADLAKSLAAAFWTTYKFQGCFGEGEEGITIAETGWNKHKSSSSSQWATSLKMFLSWKKNRRKSNT